jgi:hypothetical protein
MVINVSQKNINLLWDYFNEVNSSMENNVVNTKFIAHKFFTHRLTSSQLLECRKNKKWLDMAHGTT